MTTTVPAPTATSRPKVFIATPSHDHKFHASYALSLLRLQAAKLFPLHLTKVGGAGVARARNNQAAEFLTKTDAEYFFCVDADIGFLPEHFARIVNHRKENVSGLYALKQKELQWCVNALPNELVDSATGLQRVATAGTGFKCIHRSVFERMIAAYPEIAYVEDLADWRGQPRWDFFSMGVVGPGSPIERLARIAQLVDSAGDAAHTLDLIRAEFNTGHPPGRYISEDWYFDHRCADLGIPVHIDASFYVEHEGLINFPLTAPEMS
jgi:hypothetical protein